jgi:hypothetical protein
VRVIVAHEKHDDRILPATTEEEWAESSLALLAERLEDGHWYYDPAEWDKDHPFVVNRKKKVARLMELSDEEVDEFPDSVAAAMKQERHRAKTEARDDERARRWLAMVREMVESHDTSVVNGVPNAWKVLYGRRNAEYEGVELKEMG